jgi:hypothetical protein
MGHREERSSSMSGDFFKQADMIVVVAAATPRGVLVGVNSVGSADTNANLLLYCRSIRQSTDTKCSTDISCGGASKT